MLLIIGLALVSVNWTARQVLGPGLSWTSRDEWEKLTNPETGEITDQVDKIPPAVTANVRAFRVLVRNALFHRVQLAARRAYHDLGASDEAGTAVVHITAVGEL